jgi:hypothetical protein
MSFEMSVVEMPVVESRELSVAESQELELQWARERLEKMRLDYEAKANLVSKLCGCACGQELDDAMSAADRAQHEYEVAVADFGATAKRVEEMREEMQMYKVRDVWGRD